MIERAFADLPRDWAVLLALGMCEDEIDGKVKLNKAIALLQRDGFPIPNRFKNIDMGPFDEEVHNGAKRLEKENYLEIKEVPTSYDNHMVVYKLSDEGKVHLKEEIEPFILGMYRHLPFFNCFMENFRHIGTMITGLRSPDLVENVHVALFMDRRNAFKDALLGTIDALEMTLDELVKKKDEDCAICVETLGSADFALRSLKAVESRYDEKNSGNNMALYNSRQILELARSSAGHGHDSEARVIGNDPFDSRLQIQYRLFCLETNVKNYGIIEPFGLDELLEA